MTTAVVLAVYNGEKYLSYQLNSILHQQVPIDAIYIIDDHSTDQSSEIINNYQQQFPQLFHCYFNEENKGGKVNFEFLLSMATEDIIFFCDQDDEWLEDKVKTFKQIFETKPYINVVFSDARFIDDNDLLLPHGLWQANWASDELIDEVQKTNMFLRYLMLNTLVTGATMAIRSNYKKNVLPFSLNDRMWHDEWIALKAANDKSLFAIDQKVMNYRIHSSQQLGHGYSYITKMADADFAPLLSYQENLFYGHVKSLAALPFKQIRHKYFRSILFAISLRKYVSVWSIISFSAKYSSTLFCVFIRQLLLSEKGKKISEEEK